MPLLGPEMLRQLLVSALLQRIGEDEAVADTIVQRLGQVHYHAGPGLRGRIRPERVAEDVAEQACLERQFLQTCMNNRASPVFLSRRKGRCVAGSGVPVPKSDSIL